MKKAEHVLSPIEVIVLLQNYFLPISTVSGMVSTESESWRGALQTWFNRGCIASLHHPEREIDEPNGLTPKGRAYVSAILATPEPRNVWVSENGEVLNTYGECVP